MMNDWIPIAISVGAVAVAVMSFMRSTAAARAEVFLELRKRFSEQKHSLPEWYDAEAVPEEATRSELRAAELYWQNAFDEWFLTTRLDPWHLKKLWARFYEGTLERALTHPALRSVVAKLTHEGAEFGKSQEEFRASLNELCMSAYKVTLCGDASCAKCGDTGGSQGR